MDLSFPRFEKDRSAEGIPPELALLLVGIAARQAASPTALINQRGGTEKKSPDLVLGGAAGAFNPATARSIARWAKE